MEYVTTGIAYVNNFDISCRRVKCVLLIMSVRSESGIDRRDPNVLKPSSALQVAEVVLMLKLGNPQYGIHHLFGGGCHYYMCCNLVGLICGFVLLSP